MTAYTFLPEHDTKLQHLWSNLLHYADFGHQIHPEPKVDWTATYTDKDGVVHVTRTVGAK